MGSFVGHVLPGSLFLMVGAWHVWAAVARFISDPAGFRVKAWNPAPGKVRHLELYVITVGAFLDMCIEVLYATHLKIFVGPEHMLNTPHLNNFEHGGMLLMFFLYGLVALASEKTRYLPLPEGTLPLIAACAFSAEYLLFYFHSTTHHGLEGYYHILLVILIGLCIATAIAAALFPFCLASDLSNGMLIMLQGLWFYQTAFTLYGPMMPHGCLRDADAHISCHSHESQIRGELLANIQFFSLIFLVIVYVLGCFAIATSRYGRLDELKRFYEAEVANPYEGEDETGSF